MDSMEDLSHQKDLFDVDESASIISIYQKNVDDFAKAGILSGGGSPYKQLKILMRAQIKEFLRTSPCCVFFLAVTAFWMLSLMVYTPITPLPDWDLAHRLQRPVYPPFKWHESRRDWAYTPSTIEEQQLRFEEFFQYVNLTNVMRNADDGSRVKSFSPLWDFTGPQYYAPIQCLSNTDDKYDSTVIAYVKNDNDLQRAMISIVQGLVND